MINTWIMFDQGYIWIETQTEECNIFFKVNSIGNIKLIQNYIDGFFKETRFFIGLQNEVSVIEEVSNKFDGIPDS